MRVASSIISAGVAAGGRTGPVPNRTVSPTAPATQFRRATATWASGLDESRAAGPGGSATGRSAAASSSPSARIFSAATPDCSATRSGV